MVQMHLLMRIGFLILIIEGEDNLNDFSNKSFQWKMIKQQCNKCYVLHGENDSLVPISRAEELVHNLSVHVISIKNGGHLCARDGFTTFPLLRDLIVKKL